MNYDEWELTFNKDGTQDLKWLNDNGGDKTQTVNVKWETSSGETWDLGTETWNNWPNSKAGMMDIMSGGEAALGSWNPKWWDKASGRIDYSPFDPIDLVTGAVAAKWAVSGAKVAEEVGETFFRSMSDDAASAFFKTGRMPAGTETFISPTKSFAQNYSGTLFEINLNPGTVSQLENIGVRNAAAVHPYGNLPLVGRGWKSTNAFFKLEGTQVNIGLGNGTALDIFNSNIQNFRIIQ